MKPLNGFEEDGLEGHIATPRTAACLVAIVGRPNVGKSTLFNKLVGKRLAVVDDIPGVTRDRHYAEAAIGDRPIIYVDTGGFDPDPDDAMLKAMRVKMAKSVEDAIHEADVVVFVVDAQHEPLETDRAVVDLLRRSKKPYLTVANKADSPRKAYDATSHYRLGVQEILPISALNGVGLGELKSEIVKRLPDAKSAIDDLQRDRHPLFAVVGRPNAGKSSLVNKVLGTDQQIVDDRPGTTVDSIDTQVEIRGHAITLTDTAGIRRKRSVEGGTEGFAVMQALRAIDRSDVAILLIDATTGTADQDAKIAALALDKGLGLVIGINKADVLDAEGRKKAFERTEDVLNFLPWVPRVQLSAKTGRGVNQLFEHALKVYENRKQRVTTAQLNRFFAEVLEKHPPPSDKGRLVKINFITQVKTEPPTFVAICNRPAGVHPSYQKYVAKELRQRFHFEGVPLRVFYRAKH